MKKLKILFILAGDRNFASSRVRGYWIAEELARLGIQCSIIACTSPKALFSAVARLPRYDAVIFQKSFFKWQLLLMYIANAIGRITVFDLDDLPNNNLKQKAYKMIKLASCVFAGSENLVSYARPLGKNIFLVPSSIKIADYSPSAPKKADRPICLGWIGNGKDYAKDLAEILRRPLGGIASSVPVRFRLVGVCGAKSLYRSFSSIPGLAFEPVDQIAWGKAEAVRDQLAGFDIGLYPLLDNEFNRHKCGFKALEYMAMGIPVVASPVGALTKIVERGKAGFLPNSEEEWVRDISSLIREAPFRRQLGATAREKVVDEYDSRKIADEIYAIINNTALQHRTMRVKREISI